MRRIRDGAGLGLMALALAATSPPADASTVSVSGGTLGVQSAGPEATLLAIEGEAGLGGPFRDAEAVFGFPDAVNLTHIFGPTHGIWRGSGPAAGAGCQLVPGDTGAKPGPHLACRDVHQIALDLGAGDDYAAVNRSKVERPHCGYDCPVPTTINGGPGNDGLHYVNPGDAGTATLNGGPGNDSLVFSGVGSVSGGPGDDFINLDYAGDGHGIHVNCGPGNDRVRSWNAVKRDAAIPKIDTASCPPILTWRGAVGMPPAGTGLYGVPPGRITSDGHMKLVLFKATEAVRGSVRLSEAAHKIPKSDDTRAGWPIPGTRWKTCATKTIHFRLRAGSFLRVNLPIARSVSRRATPRHLVPCTFRVAAVDPQGERFHEEDATVWLHRGR